MTGCLKCPLTKPVKKNQTVLPASKIKEKKSFALKVVGEIQNDLVMKIMFSKEKSDKVVEIVF